ncbi:MaoC family dehydratase [Granulicoccus phenolivorans]|uniref:MaoC family dehydratase n=1 Tax=Granulicoccus phenolivorans TaxID=266854 RepID=UPI0011AE32A6|nr:MaoC family dehydratase [Granulicoccus phenolivorans]
MPNEVGEPLRVFAGADAIAAAVGETIGPGEWIEVGQDRIDTFAEATGDHQWIHVDPVRAGDGPYGGTIAHGFLTLAMLPVLNAGLFRVDDVSMRVNYGLDRVRFPQPVRSGSRVRGWCLVVSASAIPGGQQVVVRTTVEIEGAAKPACIADYVVRYLA